MIVPTAKFSIQVNCICKMFFTYSNNIMLNSDISCFDNSVDPDQPDLSQVQNC